MSEKELNNSMSQDDSEFLHKKRLYWHCRRGMKELDVLLVPFVEHAYEHLSQAEKLDFEQLLACEDTDMFAWFMKREEPADPRLQSIVQTILDTPPPSSSTCA